MYPVFMVCFFVAWGLLTRRSQTCGAQIAPLPLLMFPLVILYGIRPRCSRRKASNRDPESSGVALIGLSADDSRVRQVSYLGQRPYCTVRLLGKCYELGGIKKWSTLVFPHEV